MGDPAPSRGELKAIIDRIIRLESRDRDTRRPTGTQKENTTSRILRTIEYLAGLESFNANGPAFNTGDIPNDATTRWYDGTTPVELSGLVVPTNRMSIEASVGEASLAPGGSFIIAYISFRVYDANNVEVPQTKSVGGRAGRVYFNERIGMTISTGPQPAVIPDRAAYPPPYRVRLQYGSWAANANDDPASIQFNAPSLVVDIIGDGVPE